MRRYGRAPTVRSVVVLRRALRAADGTGGSHDSAGYAWARNDGRLREVCDLDPAVEGSSAAAIEAPR